MIQRNPYLLMALDRAAGIVQGDRSHEEYIAAVITEFIEVLIGEGKAKRDTAWQKPDGEWDLDHPSPDPTKEFPVITIRVSP